KKLSELFVRARTLDEIEKCERLRRLADARMEDRNRLHKRREERINKEQISRDKLIKPVTFEDIARERAMMKRQIGEAYTIAEMIQDIDEFEKRKYEEEQRKDRTEIAVSDKEKDTSPEIYIKMIPVKEERNYNC
ncbi:unnamed protein product, partial [Candidula unifasciata]